MSREARILHRAGELLEKMEEGKEKGWVRYEGPRGGEGWRNTDTGEVVYQDEKPDSEGGGATGNGDSENEEEEYWEIPDGLEDVSFISDNAENLQEAIREKDRTEMTRAIRRISFFTDEDKQTELLTDWLTDIADNESHLAALMRSKETNVRMGKVVSRVDSREKLYISIAENLREEAVNDFDDWLEENTDLTIFDDEGGMKGAMAEVWSALESGKDKLSIKGIETGDEIGRASYGLDGKIEVANTYLSLARHEVAHAVEAMLAGKKGGAYDGSTIQDYQESETDYENREEKVEMATFDAGNNEFLQKINERFIEAWKEKDKEEPRVRPTRAYGYSHAAEYWATSVETYWLRPQVLQRKDSEMFDIVNEVFGLYGD